MSRKDLVETNYYPMPSAVLLQNQKTRITIVGDHPHGVTQIENGNVEIMLGITKSDYFHIIVQIVRHMLTTVRVLGARQMV
jgi:hypothetical protein